MLMFSPVYTYVLRANFQDTWLSSGLPISLDSNRQGAQGT